MFGKNSAQSRHIEVAKNSKDRCDHRGNDKRVFDDSHAAQRIVSHVEGKKMAEKAI